MSREVFEARSHDAAGRLGRLTVPRAGVTVETPALLPVVNPHIQQIDPRQLADDFGAQIVITNAYVLYQSNDLREPAERDGLRALLDFPGAIMTDSGSFQLSEYGDIDVDTPEILAFQDAIGSDIATPVDIPTPPTASRERAEAELAETEAALEQAAAFGAGDMLVSAPIQGSTYPDLREAAARTAYETSLDVFPIGAMVPLLRTYEFGTVADAVCAAKRGLGADGPVHLFGAGHPMMFALGVALGCDLFDSAAYALYAREGRYMTVTGTDDLDALRELPCACPVCLDHTAESLETDEQALAEHNLYVSFAEMRRVREAVRRGELLELVETRVRAHPHLLDGYRAALDHGTHLEANDPITGERPFFYLSSESAARPAVNRHHDRLDRVRTPANLVLVDANLLDRDDDPDPWSAVAGDRGTELPIETPEAEHWWVLPPFGPVPPALVHTYPLTAEVPNRPDRSAYRAAVRGVSRLLEGSANRITLVHDGWPDTVLDGLPATADPIDGGMIDQ